MKHLGNAALTRADRALLGAAVVMGLGVLPAFAFGLHTDESLSPAAVRAGFVSAMPDPEEVFVGGPLAGEGVVVRHKAAQTRTKAPARIAVGPLSVADQQCLAEAMYYEARGEGRAGQMAVAEVVIRRTKTNGYPRSVCGVVYQGNPGGATNCQFSWACNGDMNRGREPSAWRSARQMAANIVSGKTRLTDITNHALFFHATSVSPNWAGLVRTTRIGNHIFYRRGGNWHPRRGGDGGRYVDVRSGRGVTYEGVNRPHGGVLLPDGRIQSVVMPAAPLNITVPAQMSGGV